MDPLATRKTTVSLLEKHPEEYYARVSSDPCFFFDSAVWTYDPRAPKAELPFVLWPFQRGTVRWMQECILDGRDFLVDKSRDMGATWMVLGLLLFNWLFNENFNALIGSWKEEYVDRRGDKNTHFERLRFMIRRLPMRLRQIALIDHGYTPSKHALYMRLVNPKNGSQVTGESTNPNFGRSARFNFVWLDEMARIDDALQREIWLGLADQTPCRAATSTPRGRANHFAKLRFSGGIAVRSLRWVLHPHKAAGLYCNDEDGVRHDLDPTADVGEQENLTGAHNGHALRSPWWDNEDKRRKANPAEMAQEVNMDYLASGEPVFNPQWSIRHARAVEVPRWRLHPIVTWSEGGKPALRWENRGEDGEFWVWQGKPRRESMYCIGVDVAEGLADEESDADYHAVIVWDVKKAQVAACLRTRNLDPRDLAVVIADLTRRWGALLTVERNGPGLAVLSVLSGLLTGYDLDTQVFRPSQLQRGSHKLSRDAGFKTTRESKHDLIELIRHWTNPDICHLRDERLVHEYTIFARLPGYKMGAPSGSHDDLVMGLGQALVAAQTALESGEAGTPQDDVVEEIIRLGKQAEKGRDVRKEVKALLQ